MFAMWKDDNQDAGRWRSDGPCRRAVRLPVVTEDKEGGRIMPAVRIGPEETYQKVKAGLALLVCSYDSETVFQKTHIDMSISFGEFQKRLPSLPKDQEIIFYCA
jgi:hypothetical protein